MDNKGAAIYINKVGLVSPAGNSPEQALAAVPAAPLPLEFPGQKALKTAGFRCDLAEAKVLLGPMKIRRLGRLQTLCLLAAKKAGLPPEAAAGDTGVYLGTGLGSLNETTAFIENMVLNGEELVKPANFINSVHNAAASSLALEFSLKGENLTVAHREVSFDAALGHAVSALRNGRAARAVVCGADELNYYHALAGEAKGSWKTAAEPLRPLASGNSRGTYPGEGAAVCLLSAVNTEGTLACVLGARTARYRHDAHSYMDPAAAADFLCGLLDSCGVKPSEIDLLLSGANGDSALDAVYLRAAEEFGRRADRLIPHTGYKQLCGDYKTASAFGFALGALALNSGALPAGLCAPGLPPGARIRTVLSYTVSRSGAHSACLLKSL